MASISRYEGLRKYLDMSCYHVVQPKDELIQGPLIMASPGLHLPRESLELRVIEVCLDLLEPHRSIANNYPGPGHRGKQTLIPATCGLHCCESSPEQCTLPIPTEFQI